MMRRLRPLRTHRVVLTALVLAMLSTCSPKPGSLTRVIEGGVLRVATTNSPTTCYDGPAGPTGYECDLLRAFAESIGVKLQLVYVANGAQAVVRVASGQVDIGAAGLNVTPAYGAIVRFTRPVQTVRQQLVYRADRGKPADLDHLDGQLAVPAGSSMAERLAQMRIKHPDLIWLEVPDAGANDLISRVVDGELAYTVANSDLIAINQRTSTRLRVAFDLSGNENVAWALAPTSDAKARDSLFAAVQNWLQALPEKELARVRDRHFGKFENDEYQGVVRLVADAEERLPKYRQFFEDAAERYGLDWRALAAVGYQESKWNPDAVSFTGVRGIMMLTLDTAEHMDVTDREDPRQSIEGGARYLAQLLRKMPPGVSDPDRTWMALAAYNQGLGHLEDARVLAQKAGKNPNRWDDVRAALPLLAQERWYVDTRHGYARGGEAVHFVDNVRSYYDLLAWVTGGRSVAPSPAAQAAAVKSASDPQDGPAEGVR